MSMLLRLPVYLPLAVAVPALILMMRIADFCHFAVVVCSTSLCRPDKAKLPSGGAGCLMALRLSGSHFVLSHVKQPVQTDGFFTCPMLGSLWRASCLPIYGPLLRQRSNPPRRISPPQERVLTDRPQMNKGPVFRLSLSFYLMPAVPLPSHGETPHYHRRYGVSLLSSAWGQVGPPR